MIYFQEIWNKSSMATYLDLDPSEIPDSEPFKILGFGWIRKLVSYSSLFILAQKLATIYIKEGNA